ncbi:MAG: hypothetical protein ABS934_02755 [Psychrobacillus sp.]
MQKFASLPFLISDFVDRPIMDCDRPIIRGDRPIMHHNRPIFSRNRPIICQNRPILYFFGITASLFLNSFPITSIYL